MRKTNEKKSLKRQNVVNVKIIVKNHISNKNIQEYGLHFVPTYYKFFIRWGTIPYYYGATYMKNFHTWALAAQDHKTLEEAITSKAESTSFMSVNSCTLLLVLNF